MIGEDFGYILSEKRQREIHLMSDIIGGRADGLCKKADGCLLSG